MKNLKMNLKLLVIIISKILKNKIYLNKQFLIHTQAKQNNHYISRYFFSLILLFILHQMLSWQLRDEVGICCHFIYRLPFLRRFVTTFCLWHLLHSRKDWCLFLDRISNFRHLWRGILSSSQFFAFILLCMRLIVSFLMCI